MSDPEQEASLEDQVTARAPHPHEEGSSLIDDLVLEVLDQLRSETPPRMLDHGDLR